MSAEPCPDVPLFKKTAAEEGSVSGAPDPTSDEARERQYWGEDPSRNVEARFRAYGLAEDPDNIAYQLVNIAHDLRKRWYGKQPYRTEVADVGGNVGNDARWLLSKSPRVRVVDRAMQYVGDRLMGWRTDEESGRQGIIGIPFTVGEANIALGSLGLITCFKTMYHLTPAEQEEALAKMESWLEPEGALVVTTSGKLNKALQHDRIQVKLAKWLWFHYSTNKSEGEPDAPDVHEPNRMNKGFTEGGVELLEKYFDVVGTVFKDTVIKYNRHRLDVLKGSIRSLRTEYSLEAPEGVFELAMKRALAEEILGSAAIHAAMKPEEVMSEEVIDHLLENGDWELVEPVVEIGWVGFKKLNDVTEIKKTESPSASSTPDDDWDEGLRKELSQPEPAGV